MKKTFSYILAFLLLISACPAISALGHSVVCEPRYNMADSLETGIARVSENSAWALADKNGKAITGFSWEAIGDTDSDIIPAKKNGKWGYITRTGAVKIPYGFSMASEFREGIALVKTLDGVYSYINASGDILFTSPFDYSFAPHEGAICGVSADGLYGYADTAGHILIPAKYEMAFDFHEGYAAVKSDGKWGYITTYGDYSVLPVYDNATDFSGGYAVCRLSEKYGIINTKGAKTSSFTFDYIAPADDSGRFPAKKGDICGYIDANGNWLLQTEYDFCYKFTNGVARVYKDGLWGYINEAGTQIVPPTFIDCGEYHEGVAPFSTDGMLWGYLSLDLNVAAPTNPTEPDNENEEPQVPTIQNPAITDSPRPLEPDGKNCISMKIGSYIAINNSVDSYLPEAPVLLDGTTMVPVRSIVEMIGGTVGWDAKEEKILINYKAQKITFSVGSKICFVNGLPTPMAKAPEIIGSSTMMPLRSIIDNLNCSLKWIDTDQNIFIYYK